MRLEDEPEESIDPGSAEVEVLEGIVLETNIETLPTVSPPPAPVQD